MNKQSDINIQNQHDNKEVLIKEYCNYLLAKNKEFNLIGKIDEETLYKEHVTDSLSFKSLFGEIDNIPKNFNLIDMGSGSGLPVIPLAITYPDNQMVSVESVKKKANFLLEVKNILKISNFEVLNSRLETIGKDETHRESYDIVTARALAGTSTLLEYAMPLLKQNGIFVAYKTEKDLDEINKLDKVFNMLGCKFEKSYFYEIEGKDLKRVLTVFRKIESTHKKYPRMDGIPAKKPLV